MGPGEVIWGVGEGYREIRIHKYSMRECIEQQRERLVAMQGVRCLNDGTTIP